MKKHTCKTCNYKYDPKYGDYTSNIDPGIKFESLPDDWKCPVCKTGKGEIFETLFEAKVLIERWRKEYNTFRPHSSLGYLPPAPETVEPVHTEPSVLSWSLALKPVLLTKGRSQISVFAIHGSLRIFLYLPKLPIVVITS